MTTFDPQRHHRRSIRLKGYDYARAGAYFVTICTHERRLLFDELAIRQLAEDCWLAIPDHVPSVELDEWVVMPNHIHGVLVICGDVWGRGVQGKGVQGRGVQLNTPTRNVQDRDVQDRDVQGRDVQGRDVQLNVPTDVPTDAPTMTRDPNNPFSVMSPRRNTLSVIIRTYKAAVTTACRRIGRDDFAWQHSYYEHIIRNERELHAIRQYIANNPLKWALDHDNPAHPCFRSAPDQVERYLREAIRA